MKKLFLLLLSVVAFVSCKKEATALIKPTATGRPYEVMVVMNEEPWKGSTGRALKDVLEAEIEGLPQSEAFSHVSNVSVANFSNSLKYFRNIIYVDIDAIKYQTVKMKFTRDENANEQMIISIHAPSQKAFIDYCKEHGDRIRGLIQRGEIKRHVAKLTKKHSPVIERKVDSIFNCQLFATSEINRFKIRENFIWASTPDMTQNIIMYSFPYEGPHVFNRAYMFAKRDSVVGEHIPGYVPGSYMRTDTIITNVKDIAVKGNYACEMRGLWATKGAFMGGPFVSHARVDTINNVVIVAEGFVMEFEKQNRTMMRNLEATLYTLNLPKADKTEAE